MKNTLNNKNYINIYQYIGHKIRQAKRPPKIGEIIICPDSSLYAPRDGLHLNFTGTSLVIGIYSFSFQGVDTQNTMLFPCQSLF
jgi:hypothetical protein